jgi:membrane protein required for colicin V production
MDSFTLVDAGVAGLIILSGLLAYSRGFVREVLSIGGWGVAAIVAFLLSPQAEPLIKEIPVVGDFLINSCEMSILAAFAVVFAVALIVVSIFTPLFSSLVQKSAIGGFDQGLGFLFGILRGLVLVAVAFVVYDKFVPAGQTIEIVDGSRSASLFAQSKSVIEEQIPNEAPEWIVSRYEQLTLNCAPNTGPSDAIENSGTSGGSDT